MSRDPLYRKTHTTIEGFKKSIGVYSGDPVKKGPTKPLRKK